MNEPSIARFRERVSLFGNAVRRACLSATVALWVGMASADETATRDEPFSRLREATLGYHGPAEDFTNLTELRIGWFGPSDLNDPLTGDLWWAANQAVCEANTGSALPVRDTETTLAPLSAPPSLTPSLPFRLLPRWSVDVWGTGVSQLTRMVFEEQPLALLGSIDSSATHLAEQVVAKANLPLISPIATDKTATLAGVAWMFSCAPSDTATARALVDEVLATSPAARTRITVLASTEHESRMTTREVMREFSSRGRLPDARFDLAPGVAISESVIAALQDSPPDILVIIAGVEDSARWVGTVRDRSSQQPLVFGSPAMGRTHFRTLAGRAAEGVRFPLLWAPDASDPAAAEFVTRFVAERGHEPDYAAVRTYDSTRLLLAAIRRAGPNRARIREALLALSPWPGFAGPIQFDGTGQNTHAELRLATIRAGKVVPDQPTRGYERERVANTSAAANPASSP